MTKTANDSAPAIPKNMTQENTRQIRREKITHLEQSERLDLVLFVEREAVVDARGEHEEITGLDRDADPRVGGGF
jgi:hypothetical protein